MSFSVGKFLTGGKYTYKLWAIIKTTTAKKQKRLRREREAYNRRAIYQSRHIRSLYDEINQYISENGFHGNTAAFKEAVQLNPYCLVLEYLDVPLSALNPAKYKDNPVFMAALFKGTLGGVKDVSLTKNVWTDCKPDNVLCSNVDGRNPIVKISDIGLCQLDGYNQVQMQYSCRHVSDVYSVGSTIISWLQPGVLGPQDVKPPIFADAWCIAKIIKLVETENEQTVDPPAGVASNVKSMYELGRVLLTQPKDDDNGSMHVLARPLREVLWRLGTMPKVKALLQVLLALNFQNRLPAGQVLTSKKYEAL
ncbi:hypothetical protein BU26DRAFT_524865 [Trematosphaeria pertusa]|uniref:Protein kinase domain-containing protein n=1 Tax=Trematosphaeria pertusa TaxID=390896 RepID=A0A6A6HUJ7_9PLEO|nr:uncharacterized protein BU26DRAFT_524865 [Trematosphaeria pertusa]KAF2241697.1 hypothetical protein BU26DRAFT_524865 [Trematosphaeria pertusa]